MRSGRTEKKEKILYGEKGEKGGVVKSAMKVIRMMEKNGEGESKKKKQEKTLYAHEYC